VGNQEVATLSHWLYVPVFKFIHVGTRTQVLANIVLARTVAQSVCFWKWSFQIPFCSRKKKMVHVCLAGYGWWLSNAQSCSLIWKFLPWYFPSVVSDKYEPHYFFMTSVPISCFCPIFTLCLNLKLISDYLGMRHESQIRAPKKHWIVYLGETFAQN
jgi:hypothetical protein